LKLDCVDIDERTKQY